MRILIALACLLALTGAASIEKDGINSEVLRESVEANEPSSIVHKTDADVNAVDNDVYQTDDEDAPAARNEAINGRNRYGYGRNLISSNVPQPVPKTDTDFSGSYESNGDDSNDFDSIGVLHVYYPVAYGDGVDTRGGVGRGGYGRGGFGRGGYGRGGFGRGGGYGRGSYSRAFPVYGYGQ
ncbi:Uncharacterized protein APZ42_029473 [Daphnia magna]|uniref:Uncharacterized protein n=1 Tax=Daphnia magna TaxID=35525 RepID=A0A164PLD4_9CRUS|nr:Uncharacterized protein APZ42_029473 [Daphnia magna]